MEDERNFMHLNASHHIALVSSPCKEIKHPIKLGIGDPIARSLFHPAVDLLAVAAVSHNFLTSASS